ncbi:MAG TPA: hypothetical protein VMW76_04970 [Bacteroidales bacterium]|nr:hypothetical protein [Bacteroidales bacterium]
MELFKNIRLSIGKSIIRKRLGKTHRVKKFNNLRNAHKIGIVWDGTFISEFSSITNFHREMHDRGIQIDIICYFPGKILPNEYTALRYLTCFKRSDLGLFYCPETPEVEEFINTPYEIIIDINFGRHFPLYFITSLSKAEFKVGASNTINHNTLDMTIELSGKDSITYYLDQVKHYLEMINTGV